MAAKKLVQQLVTELTADGAKMKKELDKSFKDTSDWGKKITKVSSTVRGALVGAFAGVAGGSLLSRMISETRNAASQQAQLAAVIRSTGAAAGFTQHELNGMANAMEAATSFAGGDVTQAQTAMLAFTGIVGEQFPRAMQAAADMAARTGMDIRAAAETIGRSLDVPSQGMAALSRQGFRFSESQKSLIKWMESTGRNAEAQGIILDALEESYGGAAVAARDTLGGALDSLGNTVSWLLADEKGMPSLTEAVNDLNTALRNESTKQGIDSLSAGLSRLAGVGIEGLSELGGLGVLLGDQMASWTGHLQLEDEIKKELQAVDRAIKGSFLSTPIKYLFTSDEDLERIKEQLQVRLNGLLGIKKTEEEIAGIRDAGNTDSLSDWNEFEFLEDVSKQAKKAGEEAEKHRKKLADLYASEVESLHRQLVLSGDVSNVERARYEFKYGKLKDLNSEQKLSIEGMNAELDLMDEVAVAASKQAAANAALIDVEEMLKSEAQRVNDAWDARIKIIQDAGLEQARATELIAKAEAKRASELELINEKGADAMSEYSKQAARNMQSAFADFLFDPFEDGIEGMAKNFGRILQRMAAEMMAAQLFESMAGWGQSKAGAGGLVGAVGGIASMFGGAFADGGRPPVGKISIVGDGGEPELFVPDTAGTIIPFSQLQGGGGSTTIGNVNMSFPGITNAREAEMAAGAAARKLAGMAGGSRRYT